MTGTGGGGTGSATWTFEPPLRKGCEGADNQISDVSTSDGSQTSLGDLKGSSVYPGQTLKADQNVELDFSDGSVLRLEKGSSFQVQDCANKAGPKTGNGRERFGLLLGAMWAKVTHALGGTAPTYQGSCSDHVCVAGIRGTIFWISEAKRVMTVHVDRGSVSLQRLKGSRPVGKRWIVNAGNTATWGKGSTPLIHRGGQATPPGMGRF